MTVRIAEGNKPFHRNMVCVYCQGDITDAAMVCAGCGVACHADCKTGECPTIACMGSKDRLRSEHEMEYQRLITATWVHTMLSALIGIVVLGVIVSMYGVLLEVTGIGSPWWGRAITSITLFLFCLVQGIVGFRNLRSSARLVRLCAALIKDNKAAQAEIARLRSGQPEKKH